MNATSPVIHAGPVAVRFLVEPEESGGSVSVFDCRVPPDVQTPAPAQPRRVRGDDLRPRGRSRRRRSTARSATWAPGRRSASAAERCTASPNRGASDAVFLAVASPGLFGPAYFLEIGEVVAAAAGGPPDIAGIMEVMRRHGLTPAPPAG